MAGEGRAASWVSVFHSTDGLTVVSPRASARAPVLASLDAEMGYEADVISAASADVVTAASPRGYDEVRHGLSGGATFRPALGASIAARALASWEPDYRSHAVTLSAEREWLDRRLTTTLGARLLLDEVGRSGEPFASARPLRTWAIDGAVAWVFSPRTVGQLVFEVQMLHGFMESPYRMVRVDWAGAGAPLRLPEAVPDERARYAIGAGLRHAMSPRWFAAISSRLYTDTWGVFSHTEEVEISHATPGGRFVAGASLRGYGQTSASFYRGLYRAAGGELPELRSADKLLAQSFSVLGGLRLSLGFGSVGPISALRLTTKLELLEQRFFDFAPLTWRHGVIGSFGASAEL